MQDAVHLASEDLRLGQHFVITPALAKKIINGRVMGYGLNGRH
jgi:hypothetical protein